FPGRDHSVDDFPEPRAFSVAQPAYASRKAFPRNVFLCEVDPTGERLVVRELPQHDAVRLEDVVRVPGNRDPTEWPTAFREERTDEQRHKPLEGERVLDPRFLRLAADVVAVVEHDGPASEDIQHRPPVECVRFAW